MFIDNLIRLGFTQKESEVYLMLLRVGPSPVSSLARRVSLKRATVYSVLDALIARGLVTFEQNGKYRRYIPHDPECLLFALEKQNAELKFRIDLAKTCISGLSKTSFDNVQYGHKIALYRGKEIILETLKKRIDKHVALFIMFLDFGTSLLAADCLHVFLDIDNLNFDKCFIAMPLHQAENAKRLFPGAFCKEVDFVGDIVDADLLVQGDQVFFLFSKQNSLQMIVLQDQAYAKFIREILLAPYFHTPRHTPQNTPRHTPRNTSKSTSKTSLST